MLPHEFLILFRSKGGIQPQGESGIHDGKGAAVAHSIPKGNSFTRLRQFCVDGKMYMKIPEIRPAAGDLKQRKNHDRKQQNSGDHNFSSGTGISSSRF